MVGGDRGVMEVKVVCSDVCRVVAFRIFVSKGFYFIPKRFKTFTRVNVFDVTGDFFINFMVNFEGQRGGFFNFV